MSASSSTNTSSGSTPANRDGDRAVMLTESRRLRLQLVAPADFVQRGALGGWSSGSVRRRHQILRLEHDAVVAAGHAADRLLHQRAAEIVDPPAQRLGGHVE